MAANKHGSSVLPPASYQLSDVKIQMTRHAGAFSGASIKQLNIYGSGNSDLRQGDDVFSFNQSSDPTLALVKRFYDIRFFDLPTRLNINYSVFLAEDGTVKTSARKMVDASATTVCFILPDYKKCVTYGAEGPQELENLVKEQFLQAEKSLITHK